MVDPVVQINFQNFVQAAAGSAQDLEFLTDNLGEELVADFSVQSLEKAEKLFWRCVSEGMHLQELPRTKPSVFTLTTS
jgi:hypothetical protein